MRERFEPCRRRAIWAGRVQEECRREEEAQEQTEAVLKAARRYACRVCGEEFGYPLALARHSKAHK